MIQGTDLSFGPTTTKFFSESSETSGCVALNAATARQSEPGSKLSQNFGLDSIQAAQPEPGLRSSAIVVSLANLRQ